LTVVEQAITFQGFLKLFGQKWRKVPHFVKNHEKSLIWTKVAPFCRKYQVLGFSAAFYPKVSKSTSFC